MTSARTTVVTWTGCQFRFRTSVGSSSTLRVIIASAEVAVRVSGGGRTRRLELHGLACCRYTTDTIERVVESTGKRRSGRGGGRTRQGSPSTAPHAGALPP